MSIAIDSLVKAVFQKNSVEECSVQELQQLAAKHPYFSALHLLIATKTGLRVPDIQATYTGLHFPEPLWLDYLLHNTGDAKIMGSEKVSTEPGHVFEPAFTAERTVSVAQIQAQETRPLTKENNGTPVAAQLEEHEAVAFHDNKDDNEKVEAEFTSEIDVNIEKEEPVTSTVVEAGTHTPEPLNEEMETAVNSEPESTVPTRLNNVVEAKSVLQETPLSIKPMSQVHTAEITFEPFHTVDYFASQGIRITEEEKPKDKFGQQLKSFTEWLKVLKKSPSTEIASAVTPVSEQKVERLAASSLAEREVVTETMAEVWEKQGKKDKALAVYEKLSLLNPSKSSYFAAKIDHLKNS